MSLTIPDVFTKPIIRSAFKGNELGTLAFSTMSVLVNRLLDSFAFTQKLNPTQIDILTVTALEKFEYETLEDVIIFFKMARSGAFGAAKKSLDANLLFGDWLPQYLDLKAQEREVFKNKEKGAYMDNSTDAVNYYKNRKRIEEKARKQQEEINQVNRITEYFDRQMLEDLITDWSKKPLFISGVKLLKKKRKELPWIKKDSPDYQNFLKEQDNRVRQSIENNEKIDKTRIKK
ncbi:hypothetical protein [Tenacibaculum haliotis]|uniref:hypothetical protein n=1 Tax=Tenacibaculum haliotis TaxID=1888914 RepID=UPI0021B05EAD|nr:hypothetical protein [Tenacibaculum haliotis]MCT4698476.1 hypothetical protein [Tenacibaculum haliotis]